MLLNPTLQTYIPHPGHPYTFITLLSFHHQTVSLLTRSGPQYTCATNMNKVKQGFHLCYNAANRKPAVCLAASTGRIRQILNKIDIYDWWTFHFVTFNISKFIYRLHWHFKFRYSIELFFNVSLLYYMFVRTFFYVLYYFWKERVL